MESFLNKKCQYCDQELLITDGTHICPDCGASYHQACWKKNGGCTTPGCSNQPKPAEREMVEPVSGTGSDGETTAEPPAPQGDPDGAVPAVSPSSRKRFCESCGSPLGAEEKFCPRCGRPTGTLAASAPNNVPAPPAQGGFCAFCHAPLGAEEKFCPRCGHPTGTLAASAPNNVPASPAQGGFCAFCHAPLGAEEKFCPRCGRPAGMPAGVPFAPSNQKPKNNNKKVIIISVSIAAAVLILAAVAVVVGVVIVKNNARVAAIEEYIDHVDRFSYRVFDSCATLEDIGNEMQDCWHDYVYNHQTTYDSPREAVDDAYDTLSSDVADVKSAYSAFKTDYNALIDPLPDPSDEDLSEIQDAVKELYDAYDDFYNCILNPTGNYSAFSSRFSDTDDEVLEKFNALKRLLDNYNNSLSNS